MKGTPYEPQLPAEMRWGTWTKYQAAEALNFQLSMLLYGILLIVASLPIITMIATIPLALVGFATLLFNFVGINFFFGAGSMHSYAS